MTIAAVLAILIAGPGSQDVPPSDPVEGVAIASVERRMTVPVRLGENGPYPFVVDTGAERTVIARDLAERLRLTPGPAVRLTSMTGTATVPTAMVPDLSVDAIGRHRGIQAPVLERVHLGAPGLLGLDALAGRRVSIDFARGRMAVSAATRRMARAGPDEIVVTARSRFGQLIVASAAFRGRRIRVVLDTGASISVGNLALRALAARRGEALARTRFYSVTGDAMEADQATLSQMRIGAVSLADIPVAFADAEPFRRLDLVDTPAILLGMDALRAFRGVDIDFANRQIRLRTGRESVPSGRFVP